LGNNSLEIYFLEGKPFLGHKCILNHFNQLLSTNCKGKLFLTIKIIKSSVNYFCYTSSFLKGSFLSKKTRYGIRINILSLFGRLSFIPLKGQLIFTLNF
jgi:hypothetical protein